MRKGVIIIAVLFSWTLQGVAIDFSVDGFNLSKIEGVLKRKPIFKKSHAVDSWVMTSYAQILPFSVQVLKRQYLNDISRMDIFKIDPDIYWLNQRKRLSHRDDWALDEIFFQGDLGEEINQCNLKKCKIKLHASEIKRLVQEKHKTQAYAHIIRDRLSLFWGKKRFKGYDRDDNTALYQSFFDSLRSDLRTSRFIDVVSRGDVFYEDLDLLKGKLGRRMFKIYVQSEFEEDDIHVILTFEIYNNHFFDSAMSAFFLKPLGHDKTLCVSYFSYEVDELKKGFLVHLLFKPQFIDSQFFIQRAVLDNLVKILHPSFL